ncbi:MAG: divergent PAP2 family protein [Clostridiales bacterium]|nr:divergent PAP2 family protein [Clostridiales bacterium]MCD8366444.1 divergent PAP2 family protein [Clostridiales bacterium]
MLRITFGNQILVFSVLSWFLAQVTKGIIQLITEGKFTLRRCLASGGMPSSHSAMVACCAATTGILYGFDSSMFAIACVLAIVVMYDACNVRRQSGEQAKVINLILQNWNNMTPELQALQLKVLLGHTPLQVVFGAVIGIVVAILGTRFIAI